MHVKISITFILVFEKKLNYFMSINKILNIMFSLALKRPLE